MNHTRASMLSVCTAAIIVTCSSSATALGQGNTVPMGNLDTTEKQVQFWIAVTGTEFSSGQCGFMLETTGDDVLFNIIAIDTRISESMETVGTFEMKSHVESDTTLEPMMHSDEHDGELIYLIGMAKLSHTSGSARFNSGHVLKVRADLMESSVVDVIQDVELHDNPVFIPRQIVKRGQDAGEFNLTHSDIPITGNLSGSGDPQPCNRVWTWCRDEHGFCSDVSLCYSEWQDWEAYYRRLRLVCLMSADIAYKECMGECLVGGQIQPGSWCALRDITCSAIQSVQTGACRSAYVGVVTAANWTFQACGATAKENNATDVQGCECPAGMVPFPDPTSPRWNGGLPCQQYFTPLGVPDWRKLVFPWTP